jgi:hypothetical protein
MEMAVITGMHAVVYTRNAEADRAFFRDVLGFSSVDAGGGWLIFAAPSSELACHPAESNGKHELYLMCDDLQAEIAHLGEKGFVCGPSATRVGASYPQYVFRAAAISGFTSRITQQLIGRATEPAAVIRALHSLSQDEPSGLRMEICSVRHLRRETSIFQRASHTKGSRGSRRKNSD